MKDKILIVEDELDIATLIQVHLTELDLDSDICGDGNQALKMAQDGDYQLVMLDVMLPGISGLDICRALRSAKPLQAILMLTSRTSETDRVLGLELGADDYMSKPFSVRELQARVRTQLRRVHALKKSVDQPPTITRIGELSIDHSRHSVSYKNTSIELTSTEFDLLSFLGKHPDQVFSRAQLLDSVWGYHHSGYEHTVNSHINRLRNKLEQDSANPQIIQTVWGVGYKFNSAGVSS
jgi:two-component system alkaline phosphatase synthesis response regulator PhoP